MKRTFLTAVAAAAFAATAVVPSGAEEPSVPRTGFEQREGESWTTHEEELEFLEEVDRLSDRVEIDVVGRSVQDRPLHLVQVGHPRPQGLPSARRGANALFVCSQHGNEPAGREACLQLLRDLAFTKDPTLVSQLSKATMIFVPSANPDGRAADTRGNAKGVDINRDHLNLTTPEARAIAAVVRDWRPDVVLDLHEYGPSVPGVYDDELLYLWPRNLNVDTEVHSLSKALSNDFIEPGAEEEGYSADEYGQYELADNDIHQSAGDGDEGILRNAMGLRHSIGVLVESAVTQDPKNGPQEVTSEAAVQLRRVASHLVVSDHTLRFLREKSRDAERETDRAARRKTIEGKKRSAPVYFGGADNDEPSEEEMQDPPPCGYTLTKEQATKLRPVLRLLGIKTRKAGGGTYVSLAQPAEPLIPLLLDERGQRSSVAATPDDC